jgi:hypothetical protein
MNLNIAFPLRFYINLNKHDDRRRRIENELLDKQITDFERIPAVDRKWVREAKGHWDCARYAQALSHKMAVWRARQRRASNVLIFEDDALLVPDFHERLAVIDLPEDWAIFYFGCQHLDRPEVVGKGLVRVTRAWDMHMYAVNAKYYNRVMSVLTPGHRGDTTHLNPCDLQVSTLHAELPVYAAYPNLAGQPREQSYAAYGWFNDNYRNDLQQAKFREAVDGLDTGMEEFDKAAGVVNPELSKRAKPLRWMPGCQEACGLGDRLRGLAGALAIGAIRGQQVHFWWKSAALCPGDILEVLDEDGFTRECWDERSTLPVTLSPDISFPVNEMPDAVGEFARMEGLIPPDCGSREFRLEWEAAVRRFRPSGRVMERVTQSMKSWAGTRFIGVHIRRTDVLGDGQKGITEENRRAYDEYLVSRVRDEWEKGGYHAAMLASDNYQDVELFRQRLEEAGVPAVFLSKKFSPDKVRQTGLVDAASDLILLSRCRVIFGSVWSSFAWIASVHGGIPFHVVCPTEFSGASAELDDRKLATIDTNAETCNWELSPV